ncbi:MAG: Na/Pi cotransporter family protein [Oscillospiraceae bacterium]|nr:Na/Pi cotransporter family protein [Oscillospiraceae bacterium]
MSILNIASLLGGLALFLYGISLMGDGLNQVAGNKLQVVLYRLTSNPFKGILLGIGVTALIQSSSATSIMAIGFVNSGLMQFAQAVSIILGSIVGTSTTGWIVSLSFLGASSGWMELLSTAFITGVLATIGIILHKFNKNPTKRKVGTVLLGFAVLMYGMTAMSAAVAPLRESERFIVLLTKFSNPVLGILVGMVFTAVIQSSAAAVGILQALSMTGALRFSAAFPIILGIAVGGALPVLISALGASLNARRTALVHLIIDILGALFCGVVFYAANTVHPFSFINATMNPVSVAALNTVFRIVTVAVLTPCISLLEKLVCLIMPASRESAGDKADADWDLLEERFISHPALAIEQSRIVVISMAGYVWKNLTLALQLLRDYSEEVFQEVQELEDLVDRYEDKLGTYLVKINSKELTRAQNEDLNKFLHAITDFERISDHTANIAESAKEIAEKQIEFSPAAARELEVLQEAIREGVDMAIRAFTDSDYDTAMMVEPLEELVDNLCDEIKHRHIDRLQTGICTIQHGYVFNDLLTSYERISDHCSNIAVAMIELEHDSFDTHNYLENRLNMKDEEFDRYYREFEAKYSL